MGCAGIDVKETGLKNIDGLNLQNINLNLKESLILYLSPKIPKNTKIGIYVDTVFHKKKGLEKVIKYTKRKFFIKNDTKKSFNYNIILENFLEKFPQFIKYNDVSHNTNYIFSPGKLLNDNFNNLFTSLNIETNNKTPFAICFMNEREKDSTILTKINLIKEKFENNFYVYKINNKKDKYSQYEQYTLFFHENKINYWIENDCYNNSCFNFLLNYNKIQNINDDSINVTSILNSDSIKSYLNTHSKADDEYIIKNKYYEFYNKDGNIVLFNDFPTFIITPVPNQFFNEQIIFITSKQKINICNYLINELKKINIDVKTIEIFKERINSFFLKNYFIAKKKYSLFLPSLDNNNLLNLIKDIEENINPFLKKININYSVENIIVLPEVNTKFSFYEDNKLVYIILNYSTCIKFIKTHLKEKYEEIYGNDNIKIICIYKNTDLVSIDELNNNILYINEKLLIKDSNNYIDFYMYSFNPINYFSHILIITDLEGIIKYTNYFKNRASIFSNNLKEGQLSIKQNLPLIDTDTFKNVKKFYSAKIKSLLGNIQINDNGNIIEYEDENIFEDYYKNDIFYQPYLSLKYNKIINVNKKNEKKYKNYSLNFINLKGNIEIPFSENEHKPLNEISHIYNENDKYISNQRELRCKECFAKLNDKNKYKYYLCPIAKDILCEGCYKKNISIELNYPFNLLYINCKNKRYSEYLPKDNILIFRDKIKHENHPEIMDELCDICSQKLCNNDNSGYSFYVLINIIRKNNFLICNNCFDLLNDETRSWNLKIEYNYLNELVINNFIDLDNLIFKKVKLV